MRKTGKALRILFACWMMAILAMSGVVDVVLCIGENGHVAFESSHCERGGSQEAADKTHPSRTVLRALACGDQGSSGDCLDVTLVTENVLHVAVTNPQPLKKLSDRSPINLSAAHLATTNAHSSRAFTQHPRVLPLAYSLLLQRAVVLRI